MATPDPVFLYCICSESDVQPHVHCQCGICDNKPVSRATAYRHFNRTNQLLAETASDGVRDDDSSESSCEVEDDNYGLSGQGDTASEADYGSDEEDIASGSHMNVHDMHSDEDQSGQHSQEESVFCLCFVFLRRSLLVFTKSFAYFLSPNCFFPPPCTYKTG